LPIWVFHLAWVEDSLLASFIDFLTRSKILLYRTDIDYYF
jgi:hypothetical protein